MKRSHIARSTQRHDVAVYGRFRYNGRAYEVPLRDLSAEGCRFFDRHGSLRPDTELSLKIDSMGPFVATVRWREGQYVGVQFASPL